MFLLKIANRSLSSCDLSIYNYSKYIFHNIDILQFAKKRVFSFYLRWLFLFFIANLYNLKTKTNYFISYIYFSFLNKQKLISYIVSIKLLTTNTFVNVNNIKGNPKFFYSAGMLNLQKRQKIRQPKAAITLLRTLLLRSKPLKQKPVAVHFSNLFFNHQSYVFKKLSKKIFAKLAISNTSRPHNGCRLKKKKRIKIRTRARKL